MGAFGAAAPDNSAIRQSRDYNKQMVEITHEVNKSSRNLEGLTRVLILFTIVIIGTSLPNAVTIMMSLINTNPWVFAGIFFVIAVLFMVGVFAIYPQDARTIKDNVLGRREAVPEATPERREVHGEATIEATAQVKAHNPPQFTFEDYRAAISLFVISIVFLWLSYQLKAVFPSDASNVMNDLVSAMKILFVSSVVVIVIIVYRTFRH